MRTALYARVSSQRQEREKTIGSQLDALRRYASDNGLELVEEFTDEGYSGARLDRPGLDRMRDQAEHGGFELLLTYCSDRLARKFVLQALILEEMEQFGVKVIFLEGGAADDPQSKLRHQITGAVADYADHGIMQSRAGKVDVPQALERRGTPHYPASNRDAISASGALNRPRRKPGGRTACTASSFSDGSTCR